jgi:predicted CXXCH cytochrome family protein
MKKALVALAIAALASTATAQIAGSKHDLSSGWNSLAPRTTAPLASCTFCHAPHSANTAAPYDIAPLWNRRASTATFLVKPTLATNTTPDLSAANIQAGHTLACLTCHDGVSDIGATFASGDAFTTTGNKIPVAGTAASPGSNIGSTYNGTIYVSPGGTNADLRDDHPVGIPYPTTAPGFVAAATVKTTNGLLLYGPNNNVECGSCHEPHSVSNGKFLRQPANTLCALCHTK